MGVPERLLSQTVSRIRPATATDDYGNTTYDYANGTTKTMSAWLTQQSRDEPLSNGRDPLVGVWHMVTNDSDIDGRDRIEWTAGDLTFEVDGPPKPAYTPAGYHHTSSTLKIVSG